MESFFSRFKNAFVLIAILLVQTVGLATQISRAADPLHPDGPQVRLLRMWSLEFISPIERLTAASAVACAVPGPTTSASARSAARTPTSSTRSRNCAWNVPRSPRTPLKPAACAPCSAFASSTCPPLSSRRSSAPPVRTARASSRSIRGPATAYAPTCPSSPRTASSASFATSFPPPSQLLLINDPTSGAGVVLASTRIHAIIRGTPQGRVQILNLTPDSRIKPGETLLTSGGDRVFPRGLPVGTIESIALDPEHQPFTAITIRPSANLTQLEDVLIVTGTDTAPAATDPTDQTPPVHAADISAERLPSLHDDKPLSPRGPGRPQRQARPRHPTP